MEHLPVEVVGNILSHMAAARDIVRASVTCRKWREAFSNHLRVLSFAAGDWNGFRYLSVDRVEMLITRTIFQTRGLQSLFLGLGDLGSFSASVVMSWLLYTRESLVELQYEVSTMPPNLNIVEICATEKLEKLILAEHVIEQKKSKQHRFTSLRSLSLTSVHISELDLNFLLATCPKLECLEFIDLEFDSSQVKIEVKAHNLRRFYVEEVCFDELLLESDSIEFLHLKDTNFEFLKVIGKGSLKKIRFDNVTMPRLEISDSVVNLETIDISNFMIPQPEFYRLISRSSKLRTLRLWDFAFGDLTKPVDIERVATCCPQITHLFIGCDLGDGELLPFRLGGPACFGNVDYLKVGWADTIKNGFLDLVVGLLERCPKLKKLDIDGVVGCLKEHEDCQVLARFTAGIVRIMRKYMDVDIQCEFQH